MECQTLTTGSPKRIKLSSTAAMKEVSSGVEQASKTEDVHSTVRSLLAEDHVGYVLVTCKKAKGRGSRQGEMEVQISVHGDPLLTSYLADSAQNFVDQNISLEDEE